MTDPLAIPAYPNIGRKEYMEKFEPFFSPTDMIRLRTAYTLSKEGHRQQKRDDGRRYFDHVRACSWIALHELEITDPNTHYALLLHDIVEDTFLLTPESIDLIFGSDVSVMVNLLTHRKGVSTAEYLHRMRVSTRQRVVGAKLIDRMHNLRTLGGCTPEKQRRQALETIEHYLPLAADLVDNVRPSWRWRAEYLRDHIDALAEHWLQQNPASGGTDVT